MRRALLSVAASCILAGCHASEEMAGNTDAQMEELDVLGPSPEEEPKILCDVIGERVTKEECEDVRALARDVRVGAAALNVPDPMTRGRNAQVTLVIDRRPISDILRIEAQSPSRPAADDPGENAMAGEGEPDLAATAEGGEDVTAPPDADPAEEEPALTPRQAVEELPGRDYGFRSKAGRYMRASLVGQGFGIKLLAPEDPVQEIPAGGQGIWIWEVTPLEAGQRSLTVRTEAVAKVNGRTIVLGNGQTSKSVMVEVRPIDSVKDFLIALPDWLKLIAGALTAAAVLTGAWLKLRQSMKRPAGE